MIIYVEVGKHEKPQSESQIKTTFWVRLFYLGKFLWRQRYQGERIFTAAIETLVLPKKL